MLKKIVSILFVVAISLPMFATFLEFDDFLEREGSIDENFALRDELIKFNSLIDIQLLGSSFNEDVIIGREGWLFLTETIASDDIPGDFAAWALREEKRAERCGASFLLVLVPDKKTVYEDFLPHRLFFKDDYYQSLVENLEASGVNFVEFLDLFKNSPEMLYSKKDTHWNRLGAYYAYAEILNSLGLQPAEIREVKNYERAGDLDRMLAIHEPELLPEPILESPLPTLDKVLLVHDSFGAGLVPFMENSNVQTKHVLDLFRCNSDTELVIIQVAERNTKKLHIK
jgi:hypothetical protein